MKRVIHIHACISMQMMLFNAVFLFFFKKDFKKQIVRLNFSHDEKYNLKDPSIQTIILNEVRLCHKKQRLSNTLVTTKQCPSNHIGLLGYTLATIHNTLTTCFSTFCMGKHSCFLQEMLLLVEVMNNLQLIQTREFLSGLLDN